MRERGGKELKMGCFGRRMGRYLPLGDFGSDVVMKILTDPLHVIVLFESIE